MLIRQVHQSSAPTTEEPSSLEHAAFKKMALTCSPLTHFQYVFSPGQGGGGSGAYLRKTAHEMGCQSITGLAIINMYHVSKCKYTALVSILYSLFIHNCKINVSVFNINNDLSLSLSTGCTEVINILPKTLLGYCGSSHLCMS